MTLSARGLGFRPQGRSVLVGVDLDVGPGTVLGLIGPNGGGKSSLLLLAAGLVRPTEGTVTLDGTSCAEVAVAHSGRIGLITAEPGVYPLLTGAENLHFFGGLYGLDPAEIDRRSAPYLDRLGLAADMGRPTAEWSSGMKQKLSLARALLMSPRLLLLDEPTANLDPLASRAIHETIRTEADRGVAVVLATHDLPHAEQICDEVAVIAGGVRARERFEGPRQVVGRSRLEELYVRGTAP